MGKDPIDKANIPDKLYFKIGEASEIAGVPAYVLRFWESEFKRISPKRTSSGQRLYRRRDIELILRIKDLLYNKKFTIQGAKRRLQGKPKAEEKTTSPRLLSELRSELQAIRNLLE
ncbi:MAG: MerR family transcriptional regulator [Deltaproteobacteria bacterium]|nr:MerR family transcriptional regulator [Deltaproteobacteria bacterium]